MLKKCSRCHLEKHSDKFFKNTHRRIGIRAECKDCHKLKRDKYYEQFPEKLILVKARYRAKVKGLSFSITEKDITIPKQCPILGLILNSGTLASCASLDRIDNSLGYVPGNVRVISYRANVLKGDGAVHEFKSIIDYMRGY